MTVYGYSRVSTSEAAGKQDIQRQIRELKAAGAEEVFFEHEHGDAKVKLQLSALLDAAKEGDVIMTTEISRLTRSMSQLCEIIDTIKEKKLCLRVLGSITVDCTSGRIDPFSQAFVEMAGIFSALELALIRDRVRSGVENARSKGKQIGRPHTTKDNVPSSFYKYYPSYKAGHLNKSEFARLADLSRNSVKKYIGIVEGS